MDFRGRESDRIARVAAEAAADVARLVDRPSLRRLAELATRVTEELRSRVTPEPADPLAPPGPAAPTG